MTDFDKIRSYYQQFNEWGRLDTPAGELEKIIVLEVIEQHLEKGATIFDLGGGAGRYTYELALRSFQMYLADLSPDLIAIAEKKLSTFEGAANVKNIEVANAIDLSHIKDATFENVLLFGPLYHLTKPEEIITCLKEVHRVLKPDGRLIASYIPYHCGISSILARSFRSPAQVDVPTFVRVFNEGVFNNQSNTGFQEGNYIKTENLLSSLASAGFKKQLLRSIRGIGYQQEKAILDLRYSNPSFFKEVLHIIHQTAADLPIIETAGHAILIAQKKHN